MSAAMHKRKAAQRGGFSIIAIYQVVQIVYGMVYFCQDDICAAGVFVTT